MNDLIEIDVLVGLVHDGNGLWLVNQRRPGTHMAGHWEFPGGKRAPGESRFAALARELLEELAIEVVEAEPFLKLRHRYDDRCVNLDVWLIKRFDGTPASCEGQRLRWLAVDELRHAGLLPADLPIVDALVSETTSR